MIRTEIVSFIVTYDVLQLGNSSAPELSQHTETNEIKRGYSALTALGLHNLGTITCRRVDKFAHVSL